MAINRSITRQHLNFDFWKYWTGQTISNLGSSITLFALPLLVYQLTHSAINLGIATAATSLPYPLFGLLLGAWTDRVNRKRMMIATDILRALIIATIPTFALLHVLSVWWIYIVSFIHTTLTISFNAGEFAAIPSLVKQNDLVTANGRIQASYSAASILGPLLAGLLVAIMPISMLMSLDALSFVLSALSLTLIRISFNQAKNEKSEQQQHSSIGSDVMEGLRYVLRHPVLRNISLMMALVNFVAGSVTAELVLFTKTQLHANNTQVGLFYSAGSIGMVALALLAGPLRKRWSFSTVALSALMIDGLLILFMALVRWYWLALILWAISSGTGILFNINTSSLRQAIVPNHMLGRIISIASVLAWSAIPLGTLIGGYAIAWTHNVVLVYAVMGFLTFLIPLCFTFTPLGHADLYLSQARQDTRDGVLQ